MAKRALDLLAAVLGLLLLTPLFVLIAIWIKLDSEGPVFFRQERIGRYGQPFRIHKFRTMAVNAESAGAQLTTNKDTRITRSGTFLRKYKLDELAQLIDVLKGEMSLVGPRPEVAKYVACYPAELKSVVLSVKPGITDFASIEFRNENDILAKAADPEKAYIEQVLPVKLRFHKKYAAEQGIFLDLFLIAKTVMLVFGRWAPDMLNLIGKLSRSQKRLVMLVFDAIALPMALVLAIILAQGSKANTVGSVWWLFPAISLVTIPVFVHLGLYRAVVRYMEDKSAYTILYGVTLSVVALAVIVFVGDRQANVGTEALVIYWMAALLCIGGSRLLMRSYYRRTRHLNEFKKQVVIYGAGESGVQLAAGMQVAGKKTPVAFVDDDPELQGHEVGGIMVYPLEALPRLIGERQIDQIVFSISSVSPKRREEILSMLRRLNLQIEYIPGIVELEGESPVGR